MASVQSTSSSNAYNNLPETPSVQSRGRAGASSSSRSTNASRSPAPAPRSETASPSELPKAQQTPADLHPWGAKLVQFGHAVSMYFAQAQGFFEGLVGLSSPHLDSANCDDTLHTYAKRLFEVRKLSGEAPRSVTEPMTQDRENAAKLLRQQQAARAYGDRINNGVHYAATWCKSWFVSQQA